MILYCDQLTSSYDNQVLSANNDKTSLFWVSWRSNISSFLESSRFHSGACGFTKVATAEFVSFTSPGYPMEHPPNLDCRWLLVSEEVDVPVVLRVDDAKLEECCDSLEVSKMF